MTSAHYDLILPDALVLLRFGLHVRLSTAITQKLQGPRMELKWVGHSDWEIYNSSFKKIIRKGQSWTLFDEFFWHRQPKPSYLQIFWPSTKGETDGGTPASHPWVIFSSSSSSTSSSVPSFSYYVFFFFFPSSSTPSSYLLIRPYPFIISCVYSTVLSIWRWTVIISEYIYSRPFVRSFVCFSFHSFIYSFVCAFVHSFVGVCTHDAWVRKCVWRSMIECVISFTRSFFRLFVHIFILPFICSFASFTVCQPIFCSSFDGDQSDHLLRWDGAWYFHFRAVDRLISQLQREGIVNCDSTSTFTPGIHYKSTPPTVWRVYNKLTSF